MKIRSQLLLMAAAILIPVIAVSGMALKKIRDAGQQAELRGLSETAHSTALIVDREIQGSLSALKVLGNSANLESRNFKAFYQQAAAFYQQGDSWIVLFDDKGVELVNTAVPYDTVLPLFPIRADMVKNVLSSQKPLTTDVELGTVTGKMITAVNFPAAAAGGRSFVVAQVFSVDYWKKQALQANLHSDWITGVIDCNGLFIARSFRADELVGKPGIPGIVAVSQASKEGIVRYSSMEGVDSYKAYTHSELTGWTIGVSAPVNSINGTANRAVWLAVAGMMAAFAVAALAVAVFGRRFIRAIKGASRTAMALGRGQQPDVERTGIEEIDALNHELVGAGALLEAERKFRRTAEADRERLLRNETMAREAAQAQNETKDAFLAMLGHELRNPLAAIAGATALLARTGLDTPGAERCIAIINRQNHHLQHIVNDLLDVSRLMAGKIALGKEPLDMADCVNQCVEALRPTELAKGYSITVHASCAWFRGDAVRMDQILNNLLTNALKFSEPGSEVRVTVSEVADRTVVTVQDAGAGMAPELLARVFEPFVQGPAPANRLQSGLGIGLALVRQLVRLHGGDIEAASEGTGKGSTFSFWVPAIAAVATAAAQIPETSCLAANAPRQRKLVYVEDNADARTMMAELLRLLDYEVTEVEDGASALPAVLAMQPDAVIIDIGLPDMDGYEVARRLRADPLTLSIPLIALTGFGQLRDMQAATLAGFNAHLAKPASSAAIAKTVEEVIVGNKVFKS